MIDDDSERAAWLLEQRTLPMAKILKLASLEQEFLVHGAIPSRAVTFVVGTPGAKKSWLAYDLALAISRGRPWLSLPSTKEGMRSLILNYDNPTVELARRFLRLGGAAGDQITFHTMAGSIDPYRLPEGLADLSTIVRAVMPHLIVIDSLRQSHTGDESSSKDMAAIMAAFRSWTAWGAAVVVLHHTRKAPTDPGAVVAAMDNLRGSTEIAASADCIIGVSMDVDGDGEQLNRACWIKTRGWPIAKGSETIEFSVEDSGNNTIVKAV